jgi:hypothetical protein
MLMTSLTERIKVDKSKESTNIYQFDGTYFVHGKCHKTNYR